MIRNISRREVEARLERAGLPFNGTIYDAKSIAIQSRRGTWPRPDVGTWHDVKRGVQQHGTETSEILS